MPGEKGPVRVKVLMAEVVDGGGTPGTVLQGLTVACGDGALSLVRLQREGKGAMDAETFLNGNAIPSGTVLG